MGDGSRPLTLGLVGPSRAGLSVVSAWAGTPHVERVCLWSRQPSGPDLPRGAFDAKPLQILTGEEGLATMVATCQLIVVGVRDDAIDEVSTRLASHFEGPTSGREGDRRESPLVLHLAGRLGLSALASCRRAGARIAALHPLTTFPRPRFDPDGLREVPCAVAAEEKSDEDLLKALVHAARGTTFSLEDHSRDAYHLGASLASNAIVAVLDQALSSLERSGIDAATARRLAIHLAQAAVADVAEFGPEAALTGPVRRGDEATIAAHLKSLASLPASRDLYLALGRAMLELAERAGPEVDRRGLVRLFQAAPDADESP